MSQIAADALGVPVDRIRFELGATDMPENPASTGSVTAASTGSAVNEAALALKAKIEQLTPGGLANNTTADIIAKNGGQPVEVTVNSKPGQEQQQYSMHSFGAVFTEVHVDPDLGLVRVPRVVTAHGVGKVLNAKTAASQIRGGVVWGIGMVLLEETHIDPHTGRYVNADLADHHRSGKCRRRHDRREFRRRTRCACESDRREGRGRDRHHGRCSVDRQRRLSRHRRSGARSPDSPRQVARLNRTIARARRCGRPARVARAAAIRKTSTPAPRRFEP